jgi:hypothetical protein
MRHYALSRLYKGMPLGVFPLAHAVAAFGILRMSAQNKQPCLGLLLRAPCRFLTLQIKALFVKVARIRQIY